MRKTKCGMCGMPEKVDFPGQFSCSCPDFVQPTSIEVKTVELCDPVTFLPVIRWLVVGVWEMQDEAQALKVLHDYAEGNRIDLVPAVDSPDLKNIISELLLLVEDMVSSTRGSLCLQNYARLNDAPLAARRALEINNGS